MKLQLLRLEPLMGSVELGLKLGRVPSRIAGEHLSVVGHHLLAVFLNVPDRDLDLAGR